MLDEYFEFLGAELIPGLKEGLWTSLMVIGPAALIGLAIGIVAGVLRVYGPKPVRIVADAYVSLFRGTPLIVQVFFWYAMSTQLPGPRQSIMVGPAMLSSRGLYLPGLNVSTGSAIAATVASGIRSLPRCQPCACGRISASVKRRYCSRIASRSAS